MLCVDVYSEIIVLHEQSVIEAQIVEMKFQALSFVLRDDTRAFNLRKLDGSSVEREAWEKNEKCHWDFLISMKKSQFAFWSPSYASLHFALSNSLKNFFNLRSFQENRALPLPQNDSWC